MADRVKDNVALHRFEMQQDGVTAFATYRRAGDVVTIIHTEVPKALSGHGVGSALAKGILEMLRARGDRVIAECPFVAQYIRKHPEFCDLLAAPLPDIEHARLDALLDEALAETFPASDPTAVSPRS